MYYYYRSSFVTNESSAKFYRSAQGVARCHSCASNNSALPGAGGPGAVANIPIGLDTPAVMPCGCLEDEALFEQWLVGTGAYDKRKGNGSLAVCTLSFFRL